MTSGTLTSQSHINISLANHDFSSIIHSLCQSYRLTVVEQVGLAASLYSESILGHPVAFLVKLNVYIYILVRIE